MATRRSKKVNKRFAKVNKGCPDNNGIDAGKINTREGSDNQRESNVSKMFYKTQKHGGIKFRYISKGTDWNFPESSKSGYGCLSLLRGKHPGDLIGGNHRVVGKRTPRVPVSNISVNDFKDKIVPPNKQGLKSVANAANDEEAHVATLALTNGFVTEIGNSKSIVVHMDDNQQRVKKLQGDWPKPGAIGNYNFDYGTKACCDTEERITRRETKDEIDTKAAYGISARPCMGKKRKLKLLYSDESAAIDGCQILADESFKIISASNIEFESSAKDKEDKNVDNGKKHGMTELIKSKISKKGRRNATVKVPSNDTNSAAEIKQQSCKTINQVQKSRREFVQGDLQITEAESYNVAQSIEPQKSEVFVEEGKRDISTPISKQGSFIEPQDKPTRTIVQVPAEIQASSQTIIMRRRKLSVPKSLASNMWKLNDNSGDDNTGKFLHFSNDQVVDHKNTLSHCLSSPLVRRWCVFEWFYSAIDYPWLTKDEFAAYLNHIFGHAPRLTRVERSLIRCSLGKIRLFSRKFVEEERVKLKQYRDSVRAHYTEVRAGKKDGIPIDLAQPLLVGQRVITRHAKMNEFRDGRILTIDHNGYRVQFDRTELGVDFVSDIDCMPLNPSEDMPESCRKQSNVIINKYCNGFMETKLDHKPKELKIGGSLKFGPSENMEIVDGNCRPSSFSMNALLEHPKGDASDGIQAAAAANEVTAATQKAMYSQPVTVAKMIAREDSIHAPAKFACALDKKVISTLVNLRERNTYHGNSTSKFLNNDSVSHVTEVINSSTRKARMMIDTAVRGMGDLKEDDAFVRVGDALDSAIIQKSGPDHSSTPVRYTPDPGNDVLTSQYRAEPVIVHTLCQKSPLSSVTNEVEIPKELISYSVAMMNMIQKCTERQYPPNEIAEILDTMTMSLKPCCPQNMPIYKEIQSYMGVIKTQMMALTPTPTTSSY